MDDRATRPTSDDPGLPAPDQRARLTAYLRELGPVVGAMAILSVTAPALVGFFVLGSSVIVPEPIREFLDSLGVGAPYAAAAIFAALTGAALAPTYALSFACGAIFGSMGVAGGVAMTGVIGGSMIGYAIALTVARRRVMATIERHDRARIIRAALLDRGFLTEAFIITLIRIPPNSPFALTNFTLASTRANPLAYVIGTAVGIAPRTLFAVWIGLQVQDAAEKPRWFVIGGIVVSIVVFLVLYRLFTGWARQALDRQLAAGGGSGGGGAENPG